MTRPIGWKLLPRQVVVELFNVPIDPWPKDSKIAEYGQCMLRAFAGITNVPVISKIALEYDKKTKVASMTWTYKRPGWSEDCARRAKLLTDHMFDDKGNKMAETTLWEEDHDGENMTAIEDEE